VVVVAGSVCFDSGVVFGFFFDFFATGFDLRVDLGRILLDFLLIALVFGFSGSLTTFSAGVPLSV
jgi:hypothetical protein